jgi:hypothetical protein
MPAYSAPASGGDYFGGGDSAPPKDMGKDEMREHQDDGETAVLPKSILAGKKFNPGDEVVLEVVKIMDDEVVVKYATGKDDKEDEAEKGSEAPPPPPMPEGGQESPGMFG